MNNLDQNGQKNCLQKQVINERYGQLLEQYLEQNNIQYKCSQVVHNSQTTDNQSTIFSITQTEEIKARKSQFYFTLLKKFYQIRRIQNIQLQFQGFLAQYSQQLSQNFATFQIPNRDDCNSERLNSLLMKNQLKIMRQETFDLIQNRKDQVNSLQKQSIIVASQYRDLVCKLVHRNAQLNIQNLQLQLEIKSNQNYHQQKTTNVFNKNDQINKNDQLKNKIDEKKKKNSVSKGIMSKQIKNNDDGKKLELQRIKLIVNNNIWGWGDKINDRLNKLKQLKVEMQKLSSKLLYRKCKSS